MAKKDESKDEPKRVLGPGAQGDIDHPDTGAPAAAPTLEDFAPVTEVHTDKKEDK